MNIKILSKLYKIVGGFVGQELVDVAFLKKNIKGKDILIVELVFKDQGGIRRTAVFVLDKELTGGDYEEIAEKLIR